MFEHTIKIRILFDWLNNNPHESPHSAVSYITAFDCDGLSIICVNFTKIPGKNLKSYSVQKGEGQNFGPE
jgi:hypothetical protein